jgi:uncharacterized protein
MSHHFIDAARQGKNDWWRYLLGIVITLSAFAILGGIVLWIFALGVMMVRQGNIMDQQAWLDNFLLQEVSPEAVLANLLPHVCGLGGLLLVVWLVHQRSPLSLVSVDRKIRWRRLAWGFGVWWLLLMGLDGISAIFAPETYRIGLELFNWSDWLSFLPVLLLLIPLQTTAEELLFRGYLLQGLGLLNRNPLFLYVGGGLLFALPHFGNPEMLRDGGWTGLTYFAMGVFGVLITLRDNRLELALGEHAANNLYIALISNTKDSALRTQPLFLHAPPKPFLSFWVLLGLMALAYVLYFVWPQRVKPAGLAYGLAQPAETAETLETQKDIDD